MDPSFTGVLIGMSFLVGVGICFKVHDTIKEKGHKQYILSRNEGTLRIVRHQSKMNMVIPK